MIYTIENKNGKFEILFDDEDYYNIVNNNWKIQLSNSHTKFPYCKLYKYVKKKRIYMQAHRLIMDCPTDKVVDHINHNTLDNRKCNLRVCTKRENSHNILTNTSGFPCINFHKRFNKWRAYTTNRSKHIHLGYFNTKEEAINRYKEYIRKVGSLGDNR